jgi:hypothetical protein
MFVFRTYHPPTESFKKAEAQHSKTETYLFSSTDSIPTYLDNGLALVSETSKLWSLAKGNGTGLYHGISIGKRSCVMFQTVLLWLSDHLNENSSNASKYEETERIEYYLSEIVQQGGRLGTLVKECREGGSKESPVGTSSSGGNYQVLIF